MKCLVTGATGFIGNALLPHLEACGHHVTTWPRTSPFDLANTPSAIAMSEWIAQLHDIDVVVHLAGLAHQPRGAQDSSRYFQINRDGTINLATAAHAAGVKRFIFLSSAKVFGEGGDQVYCGSTIPSPQDAYAESKWQAEQTLMERFSRTMEIVILRPPLVYDAKAKANFASLIRCARLPIPLPFAGIDNRRSMIGLDNLVDVITLCLDHSAAAGKMLLCADERLYSLADVITSIRRAANRSPNLVRLPKALLPIIKRMLGPNIAERLFGNFQMDCRETYALLNWKPPFTMEQILRGDTRSHSL